MREPSPSCKVDSDPTECAWSFTIVLHHAADAGASSGHFETFETCEVHALTGVVRCSVFTPPDSWSWNVVGNAAGVATDAGSD